MRQPSERIKRPEEADRRSRLEKAAVRPRRVEETTSAQASGTAWGADLEGCIRSFMKGLPAGSLDSVLWGAQVARKEAAAREHFAIPADEEVWLILDTTIFGSCKVGFALCGDGMHYRDEHGERGRLGWKRFASCTLADDDGTLLVDGKHFVTTAETADLLRLLRQLQGALS